MRKFVSEKLGQENLAFLPIILGHGLAIVYLIAFFSSLVQIHGLVGSDGLLPLENYVHALNQHFGSVGRVFFAPSLFHISSADGFITLVHITGILACLGLLSGLLPAISAGLAWLCYLSVSMAGQVFFHFQWDALLLEAGFLLIFLVPSKWQLKPQFFTSQFKGQVFVWLFRLLLFKLMFSSGIVKLLSGDASWFDLTALNYHFFTQPLPNAVSWYAHQLPDALLKMATLAMLVIELILPFFIFCGRRLRIVAFYSFLFLQSVIFLTGNYTFFNLLTIVLSLSLVDDLWLFARLKRKPPEKELAKTQQVHEKVLIYGALFLVLLTTMQLMITCHLLPAKVYPQVLSSFMMNNRYGLFATMTRQRPEIELQGSHDGQDWRSYHFHYKAGLLDKAPPFIAPHQPRLDWQMWFAALSNYRQNRWLINLMYQLLEDKKNAKGFFDTNPFQKGPPKFIRAAFYDYRFARPEDRVNKGDWWQREFRGYYTPVLSLKLQKPQRGKF